MPMKKTGRSYVNTSISFPPELLAQARSRAKKLGLPFSTYVQKCLERDLIERGSIVFVERETAPILAVAEDESPTDASPKPSRHKPGGR